VHELEEQLNGFQYDKITTISEDEVKKIEKENENAVKVCKKRKKMVPSSLV